MAEKRGKRVSFNVPLQMATSLVIGAIVIFVGIPLWWKTTTTYRAQLPHTEIHSLEQQKLVCTVPVVLVSCHQQFHQVQLKMTGQIFEGLLRNDMPDDDSADIQIRYRVTSRSCTEQEYAKVNEDLRIEDLDRALNPWKDAPSSVFQIFILPESLSRDAITYVGKYNSMYTVVDNAAFDFQSVLKKLAEILKGTILNEDSLASAFTTSRGVTLNKVDPATVRALQSTPGYQLSFTLMNSDPGDVIARWNIEQAVKDYLQPFLDRLKDFAEFSISSQVLHYSELPVTPKRGKNESYFYLPAKSLPMLINPVETKIGSDVSMYPTLNFLVFIPSKKYTPLHILNENGRKVATNAFFSPRWGGIQVQNPPPLGENDTKPADYTVDLKSAMGVYLSQMRSLIGVPNQISAEEMKIAKPGQTAITEWELQALLRKRAVENISTATSTLYSLSTLLEQIHNMIINDEIAAEVYSAVDSLHRAHQHLAEGELLEAFSFSRKAIISAEKAFFDPSLLELLYFPEDQKFAIYIPLFLPVGLPVAASLYKALKWLRAGGKEKQS